MDEFGIVDRFFKRQSVRRKDVSLGIGDDTAVVSPSDSRKLVVTTDVLVSGVHFPEYTEPASIGHKVLAVNLSDIAAMGGVPAWATMALVLPQADERWLEEFSSGFFALAEQFDVQLIGGDITSGPLSVSIQLIGVVTDDGYLTRSGACRDDVIYVSGTLGDAALGLKIVKKELIAPKADRAFFLDRLNRPAPRVKLGSAIAPYATAAIDVSDGLVADLGHVCESSGVGAIVDVACLPVSACYRRCLSKVGWEPAVAFGDDYELCFTAPEDNTPAIERLTKELNIVVAPIGRITGDTMQWMHGDQRFPIHEQGYRHFR
ncbi:MAG: Thiamine-monophosphate kinase [Gammaproteobacteria bacterium]|nr:Thiamine-monophosphate kinase [Gammaproteobacteria bacterium]